MALKFKIHPLFLLFGIYFAFTGKVFSFIIYTLSALLHELGHYVASEKRGYALNKIVLMPYGALLLGNATELTFKDELKVSLAGPLVNLLVAVFFTALWWVFPVTYALTDEIVFANFALFILNLLPCYPLDGGRFLLSLLSLKFRRKTAVKVVRTLGAVLAISLFSLFIYSAFNRINYTLLFFSLFILIGVFYKSKDGEYIKIFSNLTYKPVTKPKVVKRIAVSENEPVKALYPLINGENYYEIAVLSNGGETVIKGEKLYLLLSTQSGYENLKTAIKKVHEIS